MENYDLVVAGAGAAGFFAAITAAETYVSASRILILEKSGRPLAKVRISGGGRCNLTHACFDPAELISYYPRGSKELRGPFTRFGPADTLAWFEARGLATKIEPDGRVFPSSDRSQSVIDCLLGQTNRFGIQLHTRRALTAVQPVEQGFQLETTNERLFAKRVLLAPGGGSNSAYQLASSLGHSIVPPVPSLFTFNVSDARLTGLAGVSVPRAALTLHPLGSGGQTFQAQGPLLITHWGLSGPAVLKLSAWAARALAASQYQAELQVNWDQEQSLEMRLAALQSARSTRARQSIAKTDPGESLPQRLWQVLVKAAGIQAQQTWAQASNAQLKKLAEQLTQAAFQIQGKGIFKEEFVTCGGVNLQEVDFRSMQSRLVPGLYFAGEYLDLDALTGGFNFQAAWTTGWLAGRHMAQNL